MKTTQQPIPSLMAKTKALQLAACGGTACHALLSPHHSIQMSRLVQKLLRVLGILFPPVVESHTPSIAQLVTVPVLAAAHPTIARLDGTNTPLHLIVGDHRSFCQEIGGEDVLGIKDPLPHLSHLISAGSILP